MNRLDIARLRKDFGMSQSELSRQLGVNQSFLSAIENGKSPLPSEKALRLSEIFPEADFSLYIAAAEPVHSQLDELSESELFSMVLNRFHSQAHHHQDAAHHEDHHQRVVTLEQQNIRLLEQQESLMRRNDSLAAKNDSLSGLVEDLRQEIYRLRLLLASHNIPAD